ncbi:MAG: tetratricopeptide repeat protein [Bacteroidales bacterium]|nr:tetratricopeptide repeat protein [Bacteroidales bacterium]
MSVFILAALFVPLAAYPQGDKKYIREGNREYEKENYADSEIAYRKALDKNNASGNAVFNIGNALYKQKKYEDAGRQFSNNYEMNDDRRKKSASLYNLGNSLLMADRVPESIEAYKGSLKLDPDNMEAKYNLAFAQDLLKQQEEQQQQNQDQDQENQDDKQQDQNDRGEDNNQDQQKQDQDQNQQQQQDQDQNQQQQQDQESRISREDAERILNSLANDEKDIQEQVKLDKAKQQKVKTLRNW